MNNKLFANNLKQVVRSRGVQTRRPLFDVYDDLVVIRGGATFYEMQWIQSIANSSGEGRQVSINLPIVSDG